MTFVTVLRFVLADRQTETPYKAVVSVM